MWKMNDKKIKKIILGGAIGNCVHVAGVYEYLRLAEKVGYKTEFIGPAVTPVSFVKAIAELKPDIVCVSYRLTPKVLYDILKSFFDELNNAGLLEGRLYYFGGTPECVNVAKQFSYFSQYFIGEEKLSYLIQTLSIDEEIAGNIKGKIEEKPMLEGGKLDARQLREMMKDGLYLPMLRHHFGLPSLEDSLNGIRKIAESEQVDIISLAPDQNAQEFFFEPEKMDRSLDGAGGIPIRSEEDMIRISEARMAGNYPRLKIYAGTTNLLKWAEMSVRLLNVAWGTIPLFWYSILDGRSKRPLEIAISENQEVIRWYAENGIPVEINDPHQWGLRETSDVITAVDGYLVAYNAKKLGVKTYIAQYMFNTPRLTSGKMDIAKMLAMSELINELEDDNFIHLKMVRAGLTHFSTDMDIAKGQLASSTLLALALKPQIIHVVSFSEASHAATPRKCHRKL
jgi:hypothetical protein